MTITNAKVVDVLSGAVHESDVVVSDGTIVRIGGAPVRGNGGTVDAGGACLLPGLIDAHVHVESSHLLPSRFGRALLARGTTTAVCDPHEIVNVAGGDGLAFMLADAEASPCDLLFTLPSCVPATDLETAGARLTAADTEALFDRHPRLLGLGEMMNYPGVLADDPEVLAKITAARRRGKPVDGHFPLGSGDALRKYAAAGITSDHESVTREEALEKVANGMSVFIREGSSARNLDAVVAAVTDANKASFCFCADDASAAHLLESGDVLCALRKAVKAGLDPLMAVRIATLNAARHYGLSDRGAIAEGLRADMLLVRDLENFEIVRVFKSGKPFEPSPDPAPAPAPRAITASVRIDPDFRLAFPEPPPGATAANVIRILPTEIITARERVALDGLADGSIARLAVVSRYGNGNVSCGFVKNTGLRSGAVAQTIGHDSHNVTVVGKSVADMELAVRRLGEIQGGVVVACGGRVLAEFALPYGGLMCDLPAAEAAKRETALIRTMRSLGVTLPSPVVSLSFLSLPVIPELKLTDKGLVDGTAFSFVPLYF